MLNKYKGRNDVVRKHVELKILLKTISFSLGQIFNTSNTEVIKFAFECCPEPMLSQHFNCANLMSHFLFDYTWLLYKSSLTTHPPRPEAIRPHSEPWFPMTGLRSHTHWTTVELLWTSDQPDVENCT